MDAESIRLKAYRVKGGAIVTVTRGDRSRRYRVSLLRLARLSWLLVGWPGSHGSHLRGNAFDIGLQSPAGYRAALDNVYRYGGRKARSFFPGLRAPSRRASSVLPPAALNPAGTTPRRDGAGAF